MAKKENNTQETFDILKRELKEGIFRRLYLFYGQEHYLRDHYLKLLRDKLLSGPARDFNDHRFSRETMDMESLTDAVEALPMMAEYSYVQVDDCDLSRLSDSDAAQLVKVLSDIPDYCTVVFVFDSGKPKTNERQKELKKIMSSAFAVEFACQSQRELTTWIRRRLRSYGKDMEDRLCEHLTFLTGGTMTALAAEIDKLAAFSAGDIVTPQDIASVVVPVLDAQVFDLTDAIAGGDYETALVKLRTLLQMQEEPIAILGAIGGQLRRLMYARTAMDAGKGEAGVAELLKLSAGRAPHPYVLQKTVTAARRLPDHFFRAAMEVCLETDRILKGYGDAQRALELLILTLAQEVRRG